MLLTDGTLAARGLPLGFPAGIGLVATPFVWGGRTGVAGFGEDTAVLRTFASFLISFGCTTGFESGFDAGALIT
jgi:hypothetical protein